MKMKNSNEVPFWERKVNPITMFNSDTSSQSRMNTSNYKIGNYVKDSELKDYVSGNFLIEELGIGGKKLKQLFLSIGEHPKCNNGGTFYRKDCIEAVNDLLNEQKQAVDIKENYISNRELMSMFGFSEFKAWDIAKKDKLIKKRFNRNIIYYEREKAIEAFSKYKK